MIKTVPMATSLIAATAAADRPLDGCNGIFAEGRKQTGYDSTPTKGIRVRRIDLLRRGKAPIFRPGVNQKS